jgi:hypothetical protein
MARILQKIFSLTLFPGCVFLVITLMIFNCVFAQSNVWPSYLTVPESGEEGEESQENDSNCVKLKNGASWYQTAKELNVIDWRIETDKYSFDQQSQYNLLLYNRKTRDHTFSLPGSVSRKNLLLPSGKLGIEWVPKLNYRVRTDINTFQSTADLGPIAEATFFTIPVKIRTGVSADVWKEEMLERNFFSVLKNYSSDAGYYIGCELGDYSKPVYNLPLYMSFRASGRSIRDAGLGLMMGNVLYANELGTGDSLIFYLSDSLSNGRESYLNQGTTFTTSPWRILHCFSVSGGIAGEERLGFKPSGYYTYSLRTTKYPSGTELYSDMKSMGNNVGFQLSTNNRYFCNYYGGIVIGWNNQNWMYNDVHINSRIMKGNVSDSLLAAANNNDNLTFTAQMDHTVEIPLIWKFSLLYHMQVSRESKNYGNYFLYTGNGRLDTMWNQLERDGVEKLHHLELARRDSGLVQGGVYCDYGKSLLYYLRKEWSGTSRIRRTMKVGGFLTVMVGKFFINEDISFQGEKSDFVFKTVHSEPYNRPPQQRDFHSVLSGSWKFNETFKIFSSWDERYGDDGLWYGREYILDSTLAGDYYAIQNKTNDYIISIHLELSLSKMNIFIGGSFRDIYHLRYSKTDKGYVPSLVGEGYLYEPFIEGQAKLAGFYIKGKIKRNFNTIDPARWKRDENWDMYLSVQKEW